VGDGALGAVLGGVVVGARGGGEAVQVTRDDFVDMLNAHDPPDGKVFYARPDVFAAPLPPRLQSNARARGRYDNGR